MHRITRSFAAISVLAVAMSSIAHADSILPSTWEAFSHGQSSSATFAWAGENETFTGYATPVAVAAAGADRNINLMAGLAAPEPPAIVLAGMAIGGVVCGRSILRKRRSKTAEEVQV